MNNLRQLSLFSPTSAFEPKEYEVPVPELKLGKATFSHRAEITDLLLLAEQELDEGNIEEASLYIQEVLDLLRKETPLSDKG